MKKMLKSTMKRMPRLTVIVPIGLTAFAVVVASLIFVSLPASSHNSIRPTANSSQLTNCGPGVPAEKCNPSLYVPPTSTTPTSTNPTGPAPVAVPGLTLCGQGFFSDQEMAELTVRFGSISCFSLPGSNQWVVTGDGMSTTSSATPPPATSGGGIVAVETCKITDATCLNPNSLHSFSNFGVSYPPLPTSGQLKLQSTFGSHFVQVTDASCGPFTIDTTNLSWYVTSVAAVSALSSGGTPPPSVTVPSSASGAAALSTVAPAGDPGSCPAQSNGS